MTVSIPPNLKWLGFCLVKANDKRPFEDEWQNFPYAYDDPKLQRHLQGGGNFGVVCGYDDLMVLDVDDLAAFAEAVDLKRLPETFTVRTGGGGLHFYFIVKGGDHRKIVLNGDNGTHLGELQGEATMVVGPNSIHPNGNRYEIQTDHEIAEIEYKELAEILRAVMPQEKKRKRRMPTSVDDDPFAGVSILDIINTAGFTEEGGRLVGPHPVHGSTTGHNLVIDPVKNVWWCGRHQTGGGPSQWLAVESGLVDCSDVKAGTVSGKVFLDVMDYAVEKGIIKGRKEKTIAPKRLDLTDVSFVDDSEKTRFSPDMAARAVMGRYEIISTPDDRIWIYRDGIFSPDGDYVIEKALDDAAGDLATIQQRRETLSKIRLRTRQEYDVFDAEPYLFPCDNGIIDLRKGPDGFMSHSPDHRRTWKAPVAFDPRAKCPEIETYLSTSLDEDGRKTLIDIMAAKLTAYNFPYFSPWVGRGRNGKRLATEIIRRIWGDSLITEVEVHKFHEKRFDQIEVKGRHFIINNEVPRTATKGFDWVKKISGGDPITADVKGQDQVQFRPHALLIFDCNNPPRIDDYTKAIEERICPIWWNFSFVDDPDPNDPRERKRDPHLEEKITTPAELSGFLNVLLREVPRLIETRAIYRPGTGKELVESYDLKADHLAIFWDKIMIYEPGINTSSTKAFERYCELCHTIEVSPVSQIVFNRFGRKRGFRDGRPYFTADDGTAVRARGWYDCTLDEEELEDLLRPHRSEDGTDGTGRGQNLGRENQHPGTERTDIHSFNPISGDIENRDIEYNSIERSGKENPANQSFPSHDIDSSEQTRPKTAKPRPPGGENGTEKRIFGLTFAYYRDLKRQHGGLSVKILMDTQSWDVERARMAYDLVKKEGIV